MSSIENDFTSSPDELLTAALDFGAEGGTDFTSALGKMQNVMTSHWSTERYRLFSGQGWMRFRKHQLIYIAERLS